MRFIIASYLTGSTTGRMQVLDFVEADSSTDAVEMFIEDNPHMAGAAQEFFCIGLSDAPFLNFRFDKD